MRTVILIIMIFLTIIMVVSGYYLDKKIYSFDVEQSNPNINNSQNVIYVQLNKSEKEVINKKITTVLAVVNTEGEVPAVVDDSESARSISSIGATKFTPFPDKEASGEFLETTEEEMIESSPYEEYYEEAETFPVESFEETPSVEETSP